MLKEVEEYFRDYLKVAGGYFMLHFTQKIWNLKTAGCVHVRLAVSWNERSVGEVKFVRNHFLNTPVKNVTYPVIFIF